MDWPARLASGQRIAARVAIVVAHPDDETLWCGSLLARLDDAVLVHLTDGSPVDGDDARRLGFTRAGYARERAGELDGALDRLHYRGERRGYGVPDKETVDHLGAIVPRLRDDLAGAAVVVTHPYEGGHPDHDAAALAVARAAAAPVVEFACYALHAGERVFGRFVADPARPETSRLLDAADAARVEAGLAAHVTQAAVFGDWRPAVERWRDAPRYDFTRPPPGEGVLYDGFGWTLTGERWRAVAAGALQAA